MLEPQKWLTTKRIKQMRNSNERIDRKSQKICLRILRHGGTKYLFVRTINFTKYKTFQLITLLWLNEIVDHHNIMRTQKKFINVNFFDHGGRNMKKQSTDATPFEQEHWFE